MKSLECFVGDCIEIPLDDDSVDLVICSPPYEDARTYNIDFKLKGDAWVKWALPRYMECLRVCKGLVAWVVNGRTRQFSYSCTPEMLMVALVNAGAKLRKSPIYQRHGIPGSGNVDWLKDNYELIVCATKNGKLPWSDNTACGHPAKYPPGGSFSYRTRDGRRMNQQKHGHPKGKAYARNRRPNGTRKVRNYEPPKISNPGNVINCGTAGGGHMGHKLAHENEAPFPLKLAEFFVQSFCPPGGLVLDPFSGSGTTAHAAVVHGRKPIAMDVRQSQIALTVERFKDVTEKRAVDTVQAGQGSEKSI